MVIRRNLAAQRANGIRSPQSVSLITKAKQSKEGAGLPELDEESRLKAERRFYSYYELHMDPDSNAQGQASFD